MSRTTTVQRAELKLERLQAICERMECAEKLQRLCVVKVFFLKNGFNLNFIEGPTQKHGP